MILRRATAADAPACAAIVRHWLDAADWMPGGPSEAELTAMMRDGFSLREAYVAETDLAEAGGTVLGYLSLDANSDHIRGLYVAEPGHGTGRALLNCAKNGVAKNIPDHATQDADHLKHGPAQERRTRLSLNTHMPNTAAHRFYEREGFVTVERDIPGSDGVAEQRMEWRR